MEGVLRGAFFVSASSYRFSIGHRRRTHGERPAARLQRTPIAPTGVCAASMPRTRSSSSGDTQDASCERVSISARLRGLRLQGGSAVHSRSSERRVGSKAAERREADPLLAPDSVCDRAAGVHGVRFRPRSRARPATSRGATTSRCNDPRAVRARGRPLDGGRPASTPDTGGRTPAGTAIRRASCRTARPLPSKRWIRVFFTSKYFTIRAVRTRCPSPKTLQALVPEWNFRAMA